MQLQRPTRHVIYPASTGGNYLYVLAPRNSIWKYFEHPLSSCVEYYFTSPVLTGKACEG